MNMVQAIVVFYVLIAVIAMAVAGIYGPDLVASIGDFGTGIVDRVDHAIGYPGK